MKLSFIVLFLQWNKMSVEADQLMFFPRTALVINTIFSSLCVVSSTYLSLFSQDICLWIWKYFSGPLLNQGLRDFRIIWCKCLTLSNSNSFMQEILRTRDIMVLCVLQIISWSHSILEQLDSTERSKFPCILTDRYACDLKVVRMMRQRTLGNSSSLVCKQVHMHVTNCKLSSF